MPNDVNLFAFQIARLTLAYLLHSTLLLGGTWLFLRVVRVRSWALRERMWKLAVILPLITAAIPLPAAWSRSAAGLNFERLMPRTSRTESSVAQVEESTRQPLVAVGLSADAAKTLGIVDATRSTDTVLAPAEHRPLPVVSISADLRREETPSMKAEPTVVNRSAAEKLLTPPHPDRPTVWALATLACLLSGDYRHARDASPTLPVT